MEQDTGATIVIPRKNSTALPGSRDADVVVRAPSHAAAVSVSIPLNSAQTQTAFETYKAAILAKPDATEAAIEESVFVATKHIHLTVMMLKLYSEQKRYLAKQVSMISKSWPCSGC